MNDLIRREDVIKSLQSMMRDCFFEAEEELDAVVTTVIEIPSAELEAKVYKKQAPDKLYYFYCGNCGEMIDCSSYEDYKSIKSYCGYCGTKLDWGGNE